MQPSVGTTAREPGRWTWDDYVALPEDDARELLDGRLVEGEVPTKLHEFVVAAIIGLLFAWSREHGGFALASGYRVRISHRRAVMPDVHFFRNRTLADLPMQGLDDGHPDLVVEVISPGSSGRDRVTKREYCASIGVPEYWLIDPEARTFERLVLRDGTYAFGESFADAGRFTPDSFPGLDVDVATLWGTPPEGDRK